MNSNGNFTQSLAQIGGAVGGFRDVSVSAIATDLQSLRAKLHKQVQDFATLERENRNRVAELERVEAALAMLERPGKEQ